jgi:hypothetical protein
MAEKKMGPREAELRAMREARAAEADRSAKEQRVKENKAKLDAVSKIKAKGIGKVVNLKAGNRGGRAK